MVSKIHAQFQTVKQSYMAKIDDFLSDKRQLLRIIQRDIQEQTDKIANKVETYESD